MNVWNEGLSKVVGERRRHLHVRLGVVPGCEFLDGELRKGGCDGGIA